MIAAAPPSEPSIDAEAIADAFRPVILKLGRQLRREAQDIGISALDAQLLGRVGVRPGIGVSDLAAIEEVSRPSMSAHVKRLVASGWLTRELDAAGDQRRVRLTLTAEAQHALNILRRNRNDWLARRIACLDEADRTVLASAVDLFVRLAELQPRPLHSEKSMVDGH